MFKFLAEIFVSFWGAISLMMFPLFAWFCFSYVFDGFTPFTLRILHLLIFVFLLFVFFLIVFILYGDKDLD